MKRYILLMMIVSVALMGMRKVRFVTVWNTQQVIKLENNEDWGGGTSPLTTLKDTTRVVAWYSIDDQVRRWNDVRNWVDGDKGYIRYYVRRKNECLRDTIVATPDDVVSALEHWGYKKYIPYRESLRREVRIER